MSRAARAGTVLIWIAAGLVIAAVVAWGVVGALVEGDRDDTGPGDASTPSPVLVVTNRSPVAVIVYERSGTQEAGAFPDGRRIDRAAIDPGATVTIPDVLTDGCTGAELVAMDETGTFEVDGLPAASCAATGAGTIPSGTVEPGQPVLTWMVEAAAPQT